MKRYFLISIFLALSACATTYQETTDWDLKGGYYEVKLGDGLYKITGKTDIKGRVDFKDAERLFVKRSVELCPSGEYSLIEKKYYYLQDEPTTGMAIIPVPSLGVFAFVPAGKLNGFTVSHAEGLILCKRSPLTINEAKAIGDKNA